MSEAAAAPLTELETRAMAYLMYRTLRKSGTRWALWRPEAPRVAEAPRSLTSGDTATDATENASAEMKHHAERPNRPVWKLRAVPIARAWTDLPTVLAVLSLAAAAVLAVGVAPLVTIPMAVLVAAAMLLRRRRLR